MNKPRPLQQPANENEILDEILRAKQRQMNDAHRSLQEADRLSTLHECLRDRFVADSKKGRKSQ